MFSRRSFVGVSAAMLAGLADHSKAAPLEQSVRGVKLGLTTGSLNPLPQVAGKDNLDLVIEQCLDLGVAHVELSGGFFGPPVLGTIGNQTPHEITPDYTRTRAEQRVWRRSDAATARYQLVRDRLRGAGINLVALSNTIPEDADDAEVDLMFRHMRVLGVKYFQTNQTRVSTAMRLPPFSRRYGINPAFHPHSAVNDPNEIATPETMLRLTKLSPGFRMCLDLGHWVAGNNDPVGFLRENHARITHLHIKDRRRNNGPNVALGTGDTPIKECLVMIRDNRWPIYGLIEREYRGPDPALAEAKGQLDYIRGLLA